MCGLNSVIAAYKSPYRQGQQFSKLVIIFYIDFVKQSVPISRRLGETKRKTWDKAHILMFCRNSEVVPGADDRIRKEQSDGMFRSASLPSRRPIPPHLASSFRLKLCKQNLRTAVVSRRTCSLRLKSKI